MPPRQYTYYVYMMANRSKTLYTGMTNNLRRRVFEHKTGIQEGFTRDYKIDRLVYWESYGSVVRTIAREKQIKSWVRMKKIALIVSVNPTWTDLSEELYPEMKDEVSSFIQEQRRGEENV